MLKIFLYTLFSAALIFIAHCTCPDHAVKTTPARADTSEKIIIDKSFIPEIRTDYSVDSLFIVNDVLNIHLNYSGGCKQHSFKLFSNGMFAESNPPQVSVYLWHNNNGDDCRELVSKELRFNISALKYHTAKSIIINFDNTNKILCSH